MLQHLLESPQVTGAQRIEAYHGTNYLDDARDILRDEAILSPERQRSSEDVEIAVVQMAEDLLRTGDISVAEEQVDLTEVLAQNRRELEENGTDFTQQFLKEGEEYHLLDHIAGNPSALGSELWRDYAVSVGLRLDQTTEAEAKMGAMFKLSLPEKAVHEEFSAGEVPGGIPLDYAEEIWISDDIPKREWLAEHPSVDKYGIEVVDYDNEGRWVRYD